LTPQPVKHIIDILEQAYRELKFERSPTADAVREVINFLEKL